MEAESPNWDNVFAEGKEYPGNVAPLRRFENVSPGFLHTTGARLIAGRELTWTDVYDLRPMVMISENLAREFWGTPSAAVGKRLRQYPKHAVAGSDRRGSGCPAERDSGEGARYRLLAGPDTQPFRSQRRPDRHARSHVRDPKRARGYGRVFVNQVRQAVWSVNASLPLASVRTMQRDL